MSKERVYAILSPSEEKIAIEMTAKGIGQKQIAKKIGIAKQSVATFLKKAGLGKRRPWSPIGKLVSLKPKEGIKRKKGWQLMLTATFEHLDTGEIKGNIKCYGNFHAVKNHSQAYEECIEHGQGLCAGDKNYEESNDVWIPIYTYKESWIRWNPKEN